jgi:hypothetical protein
MTRVKLAGGSLCGWPEPFHVRHPQSFAGEKRKFDRRWLERLAQL